MEFEKGAELLRNLEVNTKEVRERVVDFERGIITVKERVRGIIATLPYACLTAQITIHLLYFVMIWLNIVPVRNGISEN